MNQLLLFIFSLIFSNMPAASTQKVTTSKPIDTLKVVNAIKLQYTAIDAKRKLYGQYEPSRNAEYKEGTLLTGYYEGTVLKMINASNYGDAGKTESDEYLNETGFFFVYSKVYEYVSPLSVDSRSNVKSMTENWYYFNNEELIKWVCAGKVKPVGSDGFIKMKSTLKDEFSKHKKLFSDFTSLKKIK